MGHAQVPPLQGPLHLLAAPGAHHTVGGPTESSSCIVDTSPQRNHPVTRAAAAAAAAALTTVVGAEVVAAVESTVAAMVVQGPFLKQAARAAQRRVCLALLGVHTRGLPKGSLPLVRQRTQAGQP